MTQTLRDTTICVIDKEGRTSYLEAYSNVTIDSWLTKWLCENSGLGELATMSKKIFNTTAFTEKTKSLMNSTIKSLKAVAPKKKLIVTDEAMIYEIVFYGEDGSELEPRFKMMAVIKPDITLIHWLMDAAIGTLGDASTVIMTTMSSDGEYADSDSYELNT